MRVLSPQAIVRAQAREALKNQWATAVIALLILLIPLYLIDGMCTAIACTVVSIITDEAAQNFVANLIIYPVLLIVGFLFSPIFNGYVRLFYRNGVEGKMDIRDLIWFFAARRYGAALRFNLSFAVRMIIPFLLFFIPVAVYEIVCRYIGDHFTDTVLYADCYFILCVLSVVLVMIYSLKYFFAFTIFAEDQTRSAGEIFRMSKRIHMQFSGSAAKLLFSYTPWFLLCMTILPILYVAPYLTQGMCIGAKWMRASYYEAESYAVPNPEGIL
jgi:uncharacterized membrane protein